MTLTRHEAYTDTVEAVDGELDYQLVAWNKDTTITEGKHSVGEFINFIDDYLTEAKLIISRNGEPDASRAALHNIRKITAMGFSCMMQNGAPKRGDDVPEVRRTYR